jgi:hypothetical protein
MIFEGVRHVGKLLILLLLFCSCDIQKRAIKNKEDRTVTETVEVRSKRIGDTVTFTIPKFTYKDTTIYTVNRQGTTLKTVFDTKGQVSEIDCFSSIIDEVLKSNKILVESIKEKDREKTEDFDSSVILYGLLVLILLVAIIAFFGFRYLKNPI